MSSQSVFNPIGAEKLPEPLLLIGGGRADAVEFAKRILGAEHHAKLDLGHHPDIHFYEPEGKSHLHPIANIQALIREAALPPFEAARQIFAILDAERMLPAAANALLKTLEEPKADAFFLLLSDHPDSLLPTILSRLHPITLSRAAPATTYDMAPLVAYAKNGEWDRLFDSLDTLEEEDPRAIFHSLLNLKAHEGDPGRFLTFSKRISEGRSALKHNVRLKSVVLNLLLCYNGCHEHCP